MEISMRTMAVTILAMALTVSGASAATGPLEAGKPAGVHQAQIETGGLLLVGGILVVAGVIAVIASNTQGNGTTSTASTSP
jgi:hypothetical protein